jgi:hypothetical protein
MTRPPCVEDAPGVLAKRLVGQRSDRRAAHFAWPSSPAALRSSLREIVKKC